MTSSSLNSQTPPSASSQPTPATAFPGISRPGPRLHRKKRPAQGQAELAQLLPLPTPRPPLNGLRLTIGHPLPSWNAVCGMGHWQRAKMKTQARESFLSGLSTLEFGSKMRITSAKNSQSIISATLEFYVTMIQARRALSQLRKKSERKLKSASKSKSAPSNETGE
jgi:hypothetical protein